MNGRPLNLLRYPRRVPVCSTALWRQVLWGGLLGALVGGALLLWLQHRHTQLHERRHQLQAQAQAWSQQRAQMAAQQEVARVQAQGRLRATQWSAQRERLARVHTALQALASETGLRLTRWQADGRKLVLQGSLPQAQDLPTVLSRLSDAWPLAWGLHSLGERQPAGTGVDWVIEAHWPPVPNPAGRQP